MKIAGKEIKDECQHCGEILNCKLFLEGHGIRTERRNVTKLIECQMRHNENRTGRK